MVFLETHFLTSENGWESCWCQAWKLTCSWAPFQCSGVHAPNTGSPPKLASLSSENQGLDSTLPFWPLFIYPSAKSKGFCLFFGLHSLEDIICFWDCIFMHVHANLTSAPILSSSILFQTQAKSSECHHVPLPMCFLKGTLCLGIWYYLSMFYTQYQPLYLICSYECIKTYVIMSLLKTL